MLGTVLFQKPSAEVKGAGGEKKRENKKLSQVFGGWYAHNS